MKRLNNKGITTIEVIICFILVVTITSAMFATVSSFNQRRIIEQYKEEIYTYKNLLTKDIQDDFIKVGIASVSYSSNVKNTKTTHSVNCVMKDGTKRQLIIIQQFSQSKYHPSGSPSVDDYYMIKYGTVEDFVDIKQEPLREEAELLEYPIPELGSTKNEETGKTVKDFSINNVWISISDDHILDIYIGFYHPELTTRYGVQIISPVNYVTTGSETGNHFKLYDSDSVVGSSSSSTPSGGSSGDSTPSGVYGACPFKPSGKKIMIIGDRDGFPGSAIEAAVKNLGGSVIYSSTTVFVNTAAGAVDLEVQQKVKDAAEKYGAGNVIVILGTAESEATEIYAETFMNGDPTYAGPLAGVALGIPVYHILTPEVKAKIDSEIWDEQLGIMEMTVDVEDILKSLDDSNEMFPKYCD